MVLAGIDFANLKIVLQEAVIAAEGVEAKPEVAMYYGEFINATIKFVVIAFVLFMVIKAMNTAKKRFEQEQAAAPPPAPAADVVLLTEIRDLLKQQN
jgi:large conductance mechanosensitive channel